jgi:hypothetical protein
MKTFIAAIALTIALPAAANAQGAPAADQHAHHQGMDHGKEHKDCCEHKGADGKVMDCCKEKDGKKPSCCEKHGQKGHDAHSGHKMKH